MINFEVFGRPNLRYYNGIYLKALQRNHEENQSGQSVSGPRFEPGNSRIRSRNVNHSTVTFGVKIITLLSLVSYWSSEL
jgi:hypothetical protein